MVDSLLELDGKTVLVIGAGQGMGEASCEMARRAGARVAALDFDEGRATAVAESIVSRGGDAAPFVANVLDVEELRSTIATADKHFGGIDGMITIVGGSTWVPLLDMDTEDWDHDHRLNLRYFFVAAQAAARAAVNRGRGCSIVSIASIDGVRSAPWHASYGASKAGLVNLVKSMAVEWSQYGIRANAVAPGVTLHPRRPLGTAEEESQLTSGIPMARRGEPEDIAAAAIFLASDMAKMITGQTLAVDGGYLSTGPFDYRRFAPPPGTKRTAWKEAVPPL